MGPTEFTTSLHFAKTARGRIAVDDHLRVLVHSTRPEEHGPTTPGQVSSPCRITRDINASAVSKMIFEKGTLHYKKGHLMGVGPAGAASS